MKYYLYSIIAFLTLAGTTFGQTFHYGQGFINGRYYAHHANNAVIIQKTVEIDADQYLGLNGYYAVTDKLATERLQKEALRDEQITRLLEILGEVLKRDAGLPKPTTPTVPTPPVAQPPEPPKVENELNKQVFTIFKNNCATCHSNGTAKAGLSLIGKDDSGEYLNDLSEHSRWNVVFRTEGTLTKEFNCKPMPLGGQLLADQDVLTLKKWAVTKMLAGGE